METNLYGWVCINTLGELLSTANAPEALPGKHDVVSANVELAAQEPTPEVKENV